MKSGFSNVVDNPLPNEDELRRLLELFLEKAIETGIQYANLSGRTNLSSTDVVYALQYQAHNYIYNLNIEQTEMNNDESSDDDLECESDDEYFCEAPDETHELAKTMNFIHKTWDTWVPDNDLQLLIKNAVDNTLAKITIQE